MKRSTGDKIRGHQRACAQHSGSMQARKDGVLGVWPQKPQTPKFKTPAFLHVPRAELHDFVSVLKAKGIKSERSQNLAYLGLCC